MFRIPLNCFYFYLLFCFYLILSQVKDLLSPSNEDCVVFQIVFEHCWSRLAVSTTGSPNDVALAMKSEFYLLGLFDRTCWCVRKSTGVNYEINDELKPLFMSTCAICVAPTLSGMFQRSYTQAPFHCYCCLSSWWSLNAISVPRWSQVGSSRRLGNWEHGPRSDGLSVQLTPAAYERRRQAEAAEEKGDDLLKNADVLFSSASVDTCLVCLMWSSGTSFGSLFDFRSWSCTQCWLRSKWL